MPGWNGVWRIAQGRGFASHGGNGPAAECRVYTTFVVLYDLEVVRCGYNDAAEDGRVHFCGTLGGVAANVYCFFALVLAEP